MSLTSLGGSEVHTSGDLPAVGTVAPAFTLSAEDLSDVRLPTTGRTVLNVFPSVDTWVCAASVRRFNELAAGLAETTVLCVSMDLPFAMNRFCGAEGIDNVKVASAFRSDFGQTYGVTMTDGPMRGLFARAVLVLDDDATVLHAQLVPDIGSEPDYDAAVAALRD
ncbi:thiol peroxidase [Nocardioides mangrovicus]|uniref:Thiol peroxidase n=1 Tax=Nocardioides mangrovicus TaxID=2478913 RepID=A0A3L8P6W2_9ACTN|nr:thiol peroxidase [Nocardioides mangrovicus]RLV50864.1 thiol peroxidase [Nocardioides mangrovicus]